MSQKRMKIGHEVKEIICPAPAVGQYHVYLLYCNDHSFYCGSTANLKNRLQEHNSGEAAVWTKKRRPVKLVYFETYDTQLSARRRETQIKGWTVRKKMNLVNGVWSKPNKDK